ncbi:DUF2889 domain-containing protein [Magnetospirillum sp. 15-1]|uniref:DUF2889 domain-containing protein n=1 Tax=Magnetospirillum sp. 15-1 TaxID=1979370 RepID=UPI000BBC14B4|nr:DUF2889 domain-containing protein [Magnetospirillum sp. 15-1]
MNRDSVSDGDTRRRPIQTRHIEYASFLRDDGLFEIEGKLVDTTITTGRAIHVMRLSVVFDSTLVIRSVTTIMDAGPFAACAGDNDLFGCLVGERISPGWKQQVSKKIGRSESCTHQVELLFSVATVAYQAIAISPEVDGIDPFERLRQKGEPPHFLDGCRAWQADGDLVKEILPEFFVPRQD